MKDHTTKCFIFSKFEIPKSNQLCCHSLEYFCANLCCYAVCSASPEKPKAQWKPPNGPGRKTPMSDAYQSDILADNVRIH